MTRKLVLPLLSAVLVVASFPPFDFGLVGLVSLAPLLLALNGARRPFLTGYCAGWAAFTGIAWWVYYAMAHFGGIPPFVAVPLMLLMTAIMAAFWGLFAWARARLRRALPSLPDIVIVPVLWVASEYLRASLPDLEFPWALLGLSLYRHLPLIQVADLGGVWTVSALVALTGAGVAAFVRDPRGAGWHAGWKPLAAALAVLILCGSYGVFRLGQAPEGPMMRVAVVQGNVPQDVKWDSRFREETFRTHAELTRAAATEGADLIIWSESATAFVYQREPDYQQRLAALVRESATPLLFGSPAFEMKDGKSSLRNRAYLLGAGGQIQGWQDKQQLVPFGEFVPFKRLLFFARPLVQAVVRPESWRSASVPTAELYDELRSIKGIGPYAAGNVLKLLGHYDYLAIDSWCRKRFSEIHRNGRKVADRTIENRYKPFGRWRGLFFWLDLTRDWYNRKVPF